jgi:hypothetical protein
MMILFQCRQTFVFTDAIIRWFNSQQGICSWSQYQWSLRSVIILRTNTTHRDSNNSNSNSNSWDS